jgi:hypothetical protein
MTRRKPLISLVGLIKQDCKKAVRDSVPSRPDETTHRICDLCAQFRELHRQRCVAFPDSFEMEDAP